MTSPLSFIEPDWPAPKNILALTTTRETGVSAPPFDCGNLGDHVGDSNAAVSANRRVLEAIIGANTGWLRQVHGVNVVCANEQADIEADAIYSHQKNTPCAVLTADCLPLLLCDQSGTQIAAVHCGWRSLAGGIVEQAIKKFTSDSSQLLAWMGPAIGPQTFEVGADVLKHFEANSWYSKSAFKPHGDAKYLADLYQLTRLQLKALGVTRIYGGEYCTYSDDTRFYSYRRDGQTGRMATVIVAK